jgi:8-oxo-dGTP diphosphatase
MKKGSGIIIENENGEILLQLREDDVKEFPDHWVLLGGGCEQGETPVEVIKREIKEEINIDIGNFEYFGNFRFNNKYDQYFFYKKLNLDLSKIKLNEGKAIKFFSKKEIQKLKLGFNMKEIIAEFFKLKCKN